MEQQTKVTITVEAPTLQQAYAAISGMAPVGTLSVMKAAVADLPPGLVSQKPPEAGASTAKKEEAANGKLFASTGPRWVTGLKKEGYKDWQDAVQSKGLPPDLASPRGWAVAHGFSAEESSLSEEEHTEALVLLRDNGLMILDEPSKEQEEGEGGDEPTLEPTAEREPDPTPEPVTPETANDDLGDENNGKTTSDMLAFSRKAPETWTNLAATVISESLVGGAGIVELKDATPGTFAIALFTGFDAEKDQLHVSLLNGDEGIAARVWAIDDPSGDAIQAFMGRDDIPLEDLVEGAKVAFLDRDNGEWTVFVGEVTEVAWVNGWATVSEGRVPLPFIRQASEDDLKSVEDDESEGSGRAEFEAITSHGAVKSMAKAFAYIEESDSVIDGKVMMDLDKKGQPGFWSFSQVGTNAMFTVKTENIKIKAKP